MFNWFDKLLVKIAKKILNKYAPTGEFIAYINEQEEKVLKKLGGYGQPVNETGVKSFQDWLEWLKTAGKVAGSAAKYYIDYTDQKRKSEIAERAYNQYAAEVAEAEKQAQAAVNVGLTPMEILNTPTTKADVTDFTAVAARGGLMNLPTKQRKRYALGPSPDDIPTIDEEVLTPHDFKMEGVDVLEEQVFYDTGRGDRANAMQIWNQMQNPDKAIFDFDFEIFFLDGGWSDMIKSEIEVGTETQMASSDMGDPQENADAHAMRMFGKPYKQLLPEELELFDLEMERLGSKFMAQGGIMAAQGGRIGYQVGTSDIPGIPGVGKAMRDVEFPTFSEGVNQEFPSNELGAVDTTVQEDVSTTGEVENLLKGTRVQEDVSTTNGNQIQESAMTLVNTGIVANTQEALEAAHMLNAVENKIPGVTKVALALIEAGHVADIREAINEAAKIIYGSQVNQKAHGGRIKKAPGGIMDLGGMEKDYRTTGGFVPLGGRERADDVPARLSKNEFVMTADAVRAAGGGSINRGAQRMYNTMKHLEASPGSKRMTA